MLSRPNAQCAATQLEPGLKRKYHITVGETTPQRRHRAAPGRELVRHGVRYLGQNWRGRVGVGGTGVVIPAGANGILTARDLGARGGWSESRTDIGV